MYNSYTGFVHNDMLYTGIMYYEKKSVTEWIATFSVVRDLEVLQQVCNVINVIFIGNCSI